MRIVKSSTNLAAVVLVTLAASVVTALAVDLTSSAGSVKRVFTRTSDTAVVVPAFSALNVPVPIDLKHKSTLVITATFTGIANSERSWGMNCSGSSGGIACHPFSASGYFHPSARDSLTFTSVVRDVPKGTGTVNIFLFANCTVACSGTEQMTVESVAVVVAAAKQ
jgi:hypothetical protein